jgi:hypothetical protein
MNWPTFCHPWHDDLEAVHVGDQRRYRGTRFAPVFPPDRSASAVIEWLRLRDAAPDTQRAQHGCA